MGMTMTQKILAAHAGFESVKAGDLIEASLDLVLGNDVTTPVAINELDKFKKKTVFDNTKIALVMDHFTPNKDIKSAEHVKQVRDFSKANNIVNYFDVGQMGIEHALLHLVLSQQVLVQQIWQPVWLQARLGSKFLQLLSLYLRVRRQSGQVVRT